MFKEMIMAIRYISEVNILVNEGMKKNINNKTIKTLMEPH
jgi:hypothetical protein